MLVSDEIVAVAMSGGVDSSVAAALLVERGYNVIGLMMRLWGEPHPPPLSPGEVQSGEGGGGQGRVRGEADARAVCAKLDIPFYLLDFEAEFKTHVVDFFVSGYTRGITPNPCLQCNRLIKFGALLGNARALSASHLATGHYARIRERAGKFELLRGVDPNKDQSYALHVLTQKQLAHALFPLGAFAKTQVREMARRFGLPVAEKDESQDVCFIAEGDYRDFLHRHASTHLVPGDIVDTHGNVLGRHNGLAFYTIGQRKGLGVAVGEPLYVLALDAARNVVTVGHAEELGRRELVADAVNWIAGDAPRGEIRVAAKIRYRAIEVPATLTPIPSPYQGDGRVRVLFDHPLRDITPGQAVVFYDGDMCLGGGVISQSGDQSIGN